MIISLLGLPRNGKTQMMCLLLLLCHYLSLDVRANCFIYGVDGFRKVEPVDLIRLLLCALGLDEAWSWLESRVSQSKISRFESLMIFQSGKMGVIIIYTAQLDSSVDTRLRSLADKRFVCVKREDKKDFVYAPVDRDDNILMDCAFSLRKSFFEEFVYGHYNTYERKLPLGFRELVHDVARLTPSKMEVLLNGQIAKVWRVRGDFGLNRVRDCSRSNVEYALIRLHEPTSYSGLVARGLQLRIDCLEAVER